MRPEDLHPYEVPPRVLAGHHPGSATQLFTQVGPGPVKCPTSPAQDFFILYDKSLKSARKKCSEMSFFVRPEQAGFSHAHDVVAAIDVQDVARDAGGERTREENGRVGH